MYVKNRYHLINDFIECNIFCNCIYFSNSEFRKKKGMILFTKNSIINSAVKMI